MSFDGYFIKALVLELNELLAGGRVKKITQTAKDAFVFLTYNKQKESQLYFDLNPSSSHCCINDEVHSNEQKSQFLMTLKKHLENSVLKEIRQYQLDRVILFDFVLFDTIFGHINKTLIFEVMGRSTNLILLDQENRIIDAYYKHFDPEKRSIINQGLYTFFPSDKVVLDESTYQEFLSLDSPKEISDRFLGISKELSSFFYQNKYRIKPFNLDVKPTLYQGSKRFYHAYDFDYDGSKKHYNYISNLLNEFYQSDNAGSKDQISQIINNQLKKYEQKRLNLLNDYEKNKDYDAYKSFADYIYSIGLDLRDKYESLDHIELDSMKTLNENAQSYYQKYHKYKKSIEPINQQLNITNDYIEYFRDLKDNLSYLNQNDYNDLIEEFKQLDLIKKDIKQPKNKKKTINLLTIKKENATIMVGKSSIQNNHLTHEVAKSNDLWLHVKNSPGAHVVLRGEKTEENLRLAAMLAAYYSPFRNSSSIPVDYTEIRYIKKIKGRPGYYVTYSHEKTIYIDIEFDLIKNL